MGTAGGAADADGIVPAGRVVTWLGQAVLAIDGHEGAQVPCGTCTACCSSGQFVLVEPDEAEALAAIPRGLLFPAPRRPRGHLLLGYDEDGRCPMLGPAGCSIYAVRPRACRAYDCRVLAAAGVDVAADGKPAIAARVVRWRFEVDDDEDRRRLAAIRAAADYLRRRAPDLPAEVRPPNATATAVVAVRLHARFLDDREPTLAEVIDWLRASSPPG